MLENINKKVKLIKLAFAILGCSLILGNGMANAYQTQTTTPMGLNGGNGLAGIKDELIKINKDILSGVTIASNATETKDTNSLYANTVNISPYNPNNLYLSGSQYSIAKLGENQNSDQYESDLGKKYQSDFDSWLTAQYCISQIDIGEYTKKDLLENSSEECRPYQQEVFALTDKNLSKILSYSNRLGVQGGVALSQKQQISERLNQKRMAFASAKNQLLYQALLGSNNFSSDDKLQANKDNSLAPIRDFDVMKALNLSKNENQPEQSQTPSLESFSNLWVKDAKGNKTVTPDLASKLSVINTLVATANKVQSSNSDNDSQQKMIKGLLAAQLSPDYLKDIKSANTVQLTRLLVINGIVNNYLQNQKLQALHNIEALSVSSSLDQAAVLSTQIQHNK
jgi:hypothetical protein